MADMLKHMQTKAQPQAIAYFAHSSTVQLMLTAMGAAHDDFPLRADNFAQMNRRKFKVSELTPFAANLAAIRYDCPNDVERNKIMFFLNQKPLDLSWCNVGLCNWSEIEKRWGHFAHEDCAQTFCKSGGLRLMANSALAFVGAMAILMRF